MNHSENISIKVPRADLLTHLSQHAHVVTDGAAMPMLKHTLFRVDPSSQRVTLRSTNMEQSYESQMPADTIATDSINSYEVLLPTHMLSSIISAAGSQDVTLVLPAAGEAFCTIVSGRNKTKIVALNPDGFPEFTAATRHTWTAEAGEVSAALAAVYEMVATDDSRYGLNGAWLESHSDQPSQGLRIVATDGHRLALARIHTATDVSCVDSDSNGIGLLIPRKFLKALQVLTAKQPGIIRVNFTSSQNTISAAIGTSILSTRLLEGDFPDYRKVVPSSQPTSIQVSRELLLGTLQRVALLTNKNTRSVRLTVSDSSITFTGTDADLGEATETIDAVVNYDSCGKNLIGVNASYLIDALKSLAGTKVPTVTLRMSDPLHPMTLTDSSFMGDPLDLTQFHIVMPMRLE